MPKAENQENAAQNKSKKTRGHVIWTAEGFHSSLDDAEWYDTAVPWRYCAARLVELDTLVVTTPLRIESDDREYMVDSPDAFLNWVEAVFERAHPQGFGHMLRTHRANV